MIIKLSFVLMLISSTMNVFAEKVADVPTSGEGIIDTHLHAYDCQPDGLDIVAQWMEANQVARVVVHALETSRPQNEEQRQVMLANYAKYKGRIDRFCIFTPDEVQTVEEAVAKLQQEKQDGAIGFGEHYGKGLMFDDPANMRLYAACAAVGLPLMFHMDGGQNKDDADFTHLENALKTYPGCTFIAHGPGWWKPFGSGACERLLQTYPNLYADISAGSGARALSKDKEYTRAFMIRHSGKLLFGTDCGWWAFEENAPTVPQFSLMEELDLPAGVKHNIYRQNAERLLFSRRTAR